MTAQPVTRLPLPPRRSVPAPLEFRWEPYSEVIREAAPLVLRHWQEINILEGLALDPDWERAYQLEQAGVLHVLAVRAGGKLVGYIFGSLLPALFHSVPWATTQGFWIDPIYREGWNGVKLFREYDKGMIERGARVLSVEVLSHFAADRGTVGLILQRLGYTRVGDLYTKVA